MDQTIYKERRRRLQNQMGPGLALFHNPAEAVRSRDVHYRYRPDSDFYYLTGFGEPDASCLITGERMILFVRPNDPEKEIWTGRRAGISGAREIFGADEAYPIDRFEEIFSRHLLQTERLYWSKGQEEAFNGKVFALFRRAQFSRPHAGCGPMQLLDSEEIVHEMRLVKTANEVQALRTAISIACEAHREAMRQTRSFAWEYEIEALLEYRFRSSGATGPAYPSIVASGRNATVLHYQTNDCRLRHGDLLLIDAGAEYDYYCADITRTYPVSGKFTSAQRDLYSLVLRAQHAAISEVRPGVSWDQPHQRAVRTLTEGLVGLGLLKGDVEDLISGNAYRPFYMHRTSHWLGMDVHDVGRYKIGDQPRLLEPGMVLTVEPGLYISEQSQEIDPGYLGIGIRIEDDVLVTPRGHEVLSAALPKEIDELEAIVGQPSS